MSNQEETKIQEENTVTPRPPMPAPHLTAPYLTESRIFDVVRDEAYHVFDGTYVTVCALTLLNGFTVIGHSACVHPDNFNAEFDRQVARASAIEEIWPLEGYLLKERLFQDVAKTETETWDPE